ncbi:hypothetical protein TSAR_002532 [Trichomalopsis sarcophagae]|uniref:Uncharacterized protein n=1 Tax=Trichomalopsis sarcophagae TaxID=543379 RepID=A0A232FKQ7_9HYME|nr:hypothetical protein TSAR_002532 [Trichomalopsis sarcophagae]
MSGDGESGLVFVVFLVARGNPVDLNDENLKSVARDLLNRVESITDSIQEIRNKIAVAPEELRDKIISFSDSQVSNEPKILNVLEEINNKPAFQGFSHCHKFFERKTRKVKDALAKNITKFINIQLRDNEISVDNIKHETAKISVNLQGDNLDKEIILCKNSDSNQCNLTGKYETEIDHSEKVIKFVYERHIVKKNILAVASKNVTNFLYFSGCLEKPAKP